MFQYAGDIVQDQGHSQDQADSRLCRINRAEYGVLVVGASLEHLSAQDQKALRHFRRMSHPYSTELSQAL